jgi:hypothetical protein
MRTLAVTTALTNNGNESASRKRKGRDRAPVESFATDPFMNVKVMAAPLQKAILLYRLYQPKQPPQLVSQCRPQHLPEQQSQLVA